MAADSQDRLGAAAIQGESDAVPVPQEAFDLGLVSAGEVHWAVSDDDVVVVSRDYDSLREEAGLDYLASTTVEDDRTLHVPAEAFEAWGDVTGGDTLHFASTGEMEAEAQCLVVPESQAREIDLIEG